MRTFLCDGTQPLSSIHGRGEIIKKSVVIDVIYRESLKIVLNFEKILSFFEYCPLTYGMRSPQLNNPFVKPHQNATVRKQLKFIVHYLYDNPKCVYIFESVDAT